MRIETILEMLEQQPTGTYAAARLTEESKELLVAAMTRWEVPNQLSPTDFHITITYSTTPCPDIKPVDVKGQMLVPVGFELFGENHDTLVLLVENQLLSDLHEEHADKYGATSTHPEYRPHVTLSYDVGPDFEIPSSWDPSSIGNLELSEMYVEPLNKTRSDDKK